MSNIKLEKIISSLVFFDKNDQKGLKLKPYKISIQICS